MPKLLLFLSFFVFLSCSKDKSESQKPVSQLLTHTVLFLDKSVSLDLNTTFVKEKYTPILQEIVQQNIQQKGDKIELWLMHENTQKGKALTLVSRTERPNMEGMNGTDKEFAQSSYEVDIQKERSLFLQKIIAQLARPNTSSSKKRTDIMASLEVLNRVASQSMGEVRAYYFSDMIESMNKPERRDFESHPPQNNTEAEAWASTDAKALSHLSNLSGVSVQMILPFEPTSTSRQNNPAITTYWNKLMTDLGIAAIEER